MASELIQGALGHLSQVGVEGLPAIIAAAGEEGSWRVIEFFAANIRNKNTRMAYLRAILSFPAWRDARGIRHLWSIKPILVAAYIEQHPGAHAPLEARGQGLPAPGGPAGAARRGAGAGCRHG